MLEVLEVLVLLLVLVLVLVLVVLVVVMQLTEIVFEMLALSSGVLSWSVPEAAIEAT